MEFNQPNDKYPNPYIKYVGFTIEKIDGGDKYPELVVLSKTPRMASHMSGKRYVTLDFALKNIDAFMSEHITQKDSMRVNKELVEIGLDPDEIIDTDEEI